MPCAVHTANSSADGGGRGAGEGVPAGVVGDATGPVLEDPVADVCLHLLAGGSRATGREEFVVGQAGTALGGIRGPPALLDADDEPRLAGGDGAGKRRHHRRHPRQQRRPTAGSRVLADHSGAGLPKTTTISLAAGDPCRRHRDWQHPNVRASVVDGIRARHAARRAHEPGVHSRAGRLPCAASLGSPVRHGVPGAGRPRRGHRRRVGDRRRCRQVGHCAVMIARALDGRVIVVDRHQEALDAAADSWRSAPCSPMAATCRPLSPT